MHPMVNIAVKAARKAGHIIARAFDRPDLIKVKTKSRNDYVTQIDFEAEQIIIEEIKNSYPDHAIIGEETGVQSNKDHEYEWIIDPIDGTTNFIHGIPHICISIAIRQNNKIEHGIIYDPLRQELFTATRGSGAQLNDRRLRISQCEHLKEALLGTGFPFRHEDMFETYMNSFTAIYPNCNDVRRAGSAALDLAYVAAGRLDGFWEWNLGLWDIAAGALLVREAGGLVTEIDGSENYLKTGNIVAGPAKILRELLPLLGN